MSGARVPQADQPIIAAGDKNIAIAVEVHRCYGILVGVDDFERFASADIPKAHCFVKASGGQQIGLRIKAAGETVPGMPLQNFDAELAAGIPETHGHVIATTGN